MIADPLDPPDDCKMLMTILSALLSSIPPEHYDAMESLMHDICGGVTVETAIEMQENQVQKEIGKQAKRLRDLPDNVLILFAKAGMVAFQLHASCTEAAMDVRICLGVFDDS